ncbi:MAG: alkaline phosphatase family protein [Candidatus Halalkalibacterium sp. M3_1C_030]
MGVIFLFIDGVGLGDEESHNPFTQKEYDAFKSMTDGQPFTCQAEAFLNGKHLFKPVDATLGIGGLPQSGTGQTALFTGENAPQKIGKHYGPFPHSGIKHLLREQSIFHKLQKRGCTCHFINAYPDIFFKKSSKRNRWSCTTLMAKSAGLPLNTADTIKEESAITAGITQQGWREKLNIDIPEIDPFKAARRLLEKSGRYDLVLYEYYLTDKAGHSRDHEKAESVLSTYSRFLSELISQKKAEDTIVLSSDHGNVEDLSTKTHTFNKVPLFAYGPGATAFADAESIMDITPGILKIMNRG